MIWGTLKSGYQRVQQALAKSGSLLGNRLRALFGRKIDENTIEELERLFYEADLGTKTTQELIEHVQQLYRQNPEISWENILEEIRKTLVSRLQAVPKVTHAAAPPHVILVVGVNGNGKTTTIAKLARRFKQEGQRVLVAAADTFRAAAIDQLEEWSRRLEIDLVKGAPKSDPAAVAFDAVSAAKARQIDLALIDTAGRLQTKIPLMQELEKIRRSCAKACPGAPHETLLVLDANSGQNAIDQAKTFSRYTPLTGLVLTKLDGRAKGGSVISIQRELNLPVLFIGVGEGAEDLQPFDAESFVTALLQ